MFGGAEAEESRLRCSAFLLRLGVDGSGVARDDADAGAVDLVRQLHHPPQHDGREEGAAGGGDPVHGARGGDGDGEAGRHLDEIVERYCCQDCWKIEDKTYAILF